MAADLKDLQNQIDRLRATYTSLTGKPAALFDVQNIEDAEKAIEMLETSIQDAIKKAEELEAGFGGIYDRIKAINSEFAKQTTPLANVNKAMKGIQGIAERLKYDQQGLIELNIRDLQNYDQKLKVLADQARQEAKLVYEKHKQKLIDKDGNELSDKALREKLVALQKIKDKTKQISAEEAAVIQAYKEGFKEINELIAENENRIKQEREINKLMGLGGAAIGGIQTALDKIGLGGFASRLGLDDAKLQMRLVAKQIQEAGGDTNSLSNKFKVLKAGISQLDIKGALFDPVSLTILAVKKLIDTFKAVDKLTGDTAKSLNISAKEAQLLNRELNRIATTSGDSALNTKGLNESLVAVGKSLGTNASLNEKDLKTYTKLREQAGFTNDELDSILKISLATGKTLDENTAEFLGQAKAIATQNGLIVNEKQLLKEVSNTSSSIVVSLGKSTSRLAEAAVQARALGVSLSKVDEIAGSLLNFEDSISAELEAELLTGKQLNLEQARYYALTNDIAGLAEEINKQLGSSEEFGKLNRIQQEAFAQAVGMSREELSKALVEQEALQAIGVADMEAAKEKYDQLVATYGVEEARKRLGDEELAKQFEQQSLQERFNQSVIQLQELLVALVEPIMNILNPLMEIVEVVLPAITWALTPIFDAFAGLTEMVTLFVDKLKEGNPIAIALAATIGAMVLPTITAAIGGIWKAVGSIPYIGPILATAAVGYMFNQISSAKSKIPKAQFGAEVKGSGNVMVGEVGPEIVSLPQGAKVNPLPVRERRDLAPQQAVAQNNNKEIQQTNNLLTQLLNKQTNTRMELSTNNLELGLVTNNAKVQ